MNQCIVISCSVVIPARNTRELVSHTFSRLQVPLSCLYTSRTTFVISLNALLACLFTEVSHHDNAIGRIPAAIWNILRSGPTPPDTMLATTRVPAFMRGELENPLYGHRLLGRIDNFRREYIVPDLDDHAASVLSWDPSHPISATFLTVWEMFIRPDAHFLLIIDYESAPEVTLHSNLTLSSPGGSLLSSTSSLSGA